MSTCQFFVEDVFASKRYVVTLRAEDIHRVRCRTIRRHLSQSAGFPYLADEFDLYCGPQITTRSKPLEEDTSGASIGLCNGAVLLLLARHRHDTSPSTSPRLAEVITSSDADLKEETEWMNGLSDKQRRMQAQLLDEFRRASSESPSPPPRTLLFPMSTSASAGRTHSFSHSQPQTASHSYRGHLEHHNLEDTAAYVVGEGWVGESVSAPSHVVPSRSTSQSAEFPNAASHGPVAPPPPPPLRRSESTRYDLTPERDAVEASPKLVGTSEEPYHSRDSQLAKASTRVAAVHRESANTSNAAQCTTVVGESLPQQSRVNEGKLLISLQDQVDSLLVRVRTVTSANEAAQREIHSLQHDLNAAEQLAEAETNRADVLHSAAVAELRQQLGIKFVKSQSDFDVIVRNFAKRKELEARCARATESQKELMGLLQAEQTKRRSLQAYVEELKGNIRVVVRVRPPPGPEHAAGDSSAVGWSSHPPSDAVLKIDASRGTLTVQSATSGTKAFEFYRVFDASATQHDVFLEVLPLVQSAVDGTNVCVFAYGQTGSGKTHTMLGATTNASAHHTDPEHWTGNRAPQPRSLGIIPRAVTELFRLVHERIDSESCVTCSLVELYNEQLFDMLAEQPNEKIDVRPLHSLAASLHQVRSADEALMILAAGTSARKIHATKLNTHSSRSHLVFTMHVALRNADHPDAPIQLSKLTFVDLAGSERVAHTQSVGERLKEAQCINKSLSALGDVIASLSNQHDGTAHQHQQHVPYRNSKLTLLLQDCVGGHSKTMLLACISPTSITHHQLLHNSVSDDPSVTRLANVQETISTLQFAARVRLVRNGQQSKTSAMKYIASTPTPTLQHQAVVTSLASHVGPSSLAPSHDESGSGYGLKTVAVNQPTRSRSKTPKRVVPMKF